MISAVQCGAPPCPTSEYNNTFAIKMCADVGCDTKYVCKPGHAYADGTVSKNITCEVNDLTDAVRVGNWTSINETCERKQQI